MLKDDIILVNKVGLSLRHCMQRIDENEQGVVFICDEGRYLKGILTDGDIRRAILSGASLDSQVESYVNRSFRFVEEGTSREQILKLLDRSIRVIPVLRKGVFVDVFTVADLKYLENPTLMVARARAPARISFGGGGTDLTLFFSEHGGAVLNATMSLYSNCLLTKRDNSAIRITSHDYNMTIEAPDLDRLVYDKRLDLIKAAIKLLKPDFGFDLEICSDFPPSSGLGGSSVVLAAVVGCFNQLRRERLNLYDIAELAFQAERIELSCSGGWQDQYAAVFGGFNFMEFRAEQNEISSLRVPLDVTDELEHRLLLCYSGKAHPTQQIHQAQKQRMLKEKDINIFAQRTRDLEHFGELMHEAWNLKKTFSGDISAPAIDSLYDYARANGAVAGKILGAGGGGYFLFQSHWNERANLAKALQSQGLTVQNLLFDHRGLRSWSVRP